MQTKHPSLRNRCQLKHMLTVNWNLILFIKIDLNGPSETRLPLLVCHCLTQFSLKPLKRWIVWYPRAKVGKGGKCIYIKLEINDNMLEQFPEAILQIFSKNTRQEVKRLVQVTHGMLSYHFIPLRVKKGLSIQVASLGLCLPLFSFLFF